MFRCLCNINHLHSVSQCHSPSPSAGKCMYWRTDKNQGTNKRCFLIVCSEKKIKKFITTPTEKWLVKLYSSFIVVHGVLSGSHLVGTVPTTLQTVTVLMPEIWQSTWKASLKICKSYYTMWQAATPDVVHGRLKHHHLFFLNRNQSLHSHPTPQIQLMQNGDCLPAREYSCASQDPESECECWLITNLAPKKCCDVVYPTMRKRWRHLKHESVIVSSLKCVTFLSKCAFQTSASFSVSQIVHYYSFLLWLSGLYIVYRGDYPPFSMS